MTYATGLLCTICGKTHPYRDDLMTCPDCKEQGILDVRYDYQRMSEVVNRAYFQQNTLRHMLRYQPLMTIASYDAQTTLQVGWTPLYHSTNLSKELRLPHLYFKDEGVNPTASLKDRASLVACLKAIEGGHRTICCSSTGNAASSLAGNAAKLNLNSVIFVPGRSPLGKQAQMLAFGADVIPVDADYNTTYETSKQFIDAYGWYNRNAAINPHLVEGKKTVALEIAEQLNFQPIHAVFVSVGDGCTIYGVYKGFFDLWNLGLIEYIPQIYGVQSSGCAPFVEAYQDDRELRPVAESTLADSIAVGVPRNPVKGMWAVTKSNGRYIAVSDEDILAAQREMAATEGLFCEPAGATGYAGLKQALKQGWIDRDDRVVVIATGNGLKDTKTFLAHANPRSAIDPDQLHRHMQADVPFETILQDIDRRGESS